MHKLCNRETKRIKYKKNINLSVISACTASAVSNERSKEFIRVICDVVFL